MQKKMASLSSLCLLFFYAKKSMKGIKKLKCTALGMQFCDYYYCCCVVDGGDATKVVVLFSIFVL